ncbi:MAG: CDP-alcohol phosphatidyltransferase family protein [Fidelibacterota bacterium]|nr:MAG: CDP-alcohol phosphatidyltransferase family protein [Candidatus Neomarinimicrobiota bacterium]
MPHPSLKNLKRVVRKSYEPEPYARYVVRPICIYFTWFFVRTPISANQVTVMQEVIGFAGAVLLALGHVEWAVVGVLLLQLGYILDCSDGEVARWKDQKSIDGVFLDLVGHMIIIPAYMFALGFGAWMRTGHIEVLVSGFLSALFVERIERDTLLNVVDTLATNAGTEQYTFDHLRSKLDEPIEQIDMGSAGGVGRRSWIQVLFRYPDSMNVITIAVLLDLIFQGIVLGNRFYPFTSLLSIIYGAVLTAGRLWQIRRVFRHSLTELRFLQIVKLARRIYRD